MIVGDDDGEDDLTEIRNNIPNLKGHLPSGVFYRFTLFIGALCTNN